MSGLLKSATVGLLFVLGVFGQTPWGGPYELHITEARECNDTGTHEVMFPVKLVRHSKSSVTFSGMAVLPYGWSDVITVQIDIAQWANGKWTEKFFSKNFGGMCTCVKTIAPDIAKQIFNGAGTKDCPPPGNYTINDITISLKFAGVPVFVYGKYRVEASLLLLPKKVKAGCYTGTAEVLPKTNRHRVTRKRN